MFSPGALNAMTGTSLGGVSSHADLAGQCRACHTAPWESTTMDDRCLACHADVATELTDLGTQHGRMMAIDPAAACRDCHPEHNGSDAPLTDIESWRYPHQLSGYFLDAHQFKAEGDPFRCSDCHGNDVTTFDVATCTTCHDQRDSGFATAHTAAYGPACLDCHDGIDSFGVQFTHESFQFKLTGKHAVVLCEKCHTNARRKTDFPLIAQDCFSCHKSNDAHGGNLGSDCAACHSTEAWRPVNFDHTRTGFPLTDAHATATCGDCHRDLSFQGASTDCFACHAQDDRHQGQLGTDCASCHKPTNWLDVHFDHSQTSFPLSGKHVNVVCASCHKNNVFKGTPKDCASCHVDAHLGQFGRQCETCHTTSAWKPANFDHSQTGFKLIGSHLAIDCKACHINNVFKGTPTDCFACHASRDVHNGQFGRDCASCHKPTKWQDVVFDHSKTSFPLNGTHTSVACKSCHVNNVFKGTPKDCISCHAAKDVHNGQFGKDCASCHKPTKWLEVVFDHSKTSFPLSGTHATITCKSCHVNNVFKGTPKDFISCHASKDVHKGQFGTSCGSCHKPTKWQVVSFDHSKTAFPLTGLHTNVVCSACHINGVYKGTPKDCYSCHAAKDKHMGQFGTVCSSCHNTSGWANVTFDHKSTGFPLSGSHSVVACSSCHINGRYAGTPVNCYACHAARDKHMGQFGTDCGSCHKPTAWSDVTFNHKNTAFPLTGRHTGVLCTACHTNGVYKGTPTNCYACHASRDAHNGQFGTNCGSCHNTSGWGNATFNHNNTNFPLVGKHTNISCTKCHANGVYQGTPSTCYACHADKDEHNGRNGTDCGLCHTPTDWGRVNSP